ncbi:MAG: hypothetical protein ABSA70_04390 [Terriglobia bacterium]
MRCEKCGQEFPSQDYFKENIAGSICTNCFAALPPEEQQTLLAQAPAVPVNRPSHSPWRRILAIAVPVLIVCVIGYFLYPRLKTSEDSLIIANEEDFSCKGRFEFELNASGKLEPVLVKAGRLVLFRTDQTIVGGAGKAGEAYRWDKNLKLKKVGKFDLKKTNEELFKEYGVNGSAK